MARCSKHLSLPPLGMAPLLFIAAMAVVAMAQSPTPSVYCDAECVSGHCGAELLSPHLPLHQRTILTHTHPPRRYECEYRSTGAPVCLRQYACARVLCMSETVCAVRDGAVCVLHQPLATLSTFRLHSELLRPEEPLLWRHSLDDAPLGNWLGHQVPDLWHCQCGLRCVWGTVGRYAPTFGWASSRTNHAPSRTPPAVPTYPVTFNRGTAIQFIDQVLPTGNCTNNQNVSVPCTPNCEVLGTGPPIIELNDNSRPSMGVNVSYYGVSDNAFDGFKCPINPVTQGPLDRKFKVMLTCDESADTPVIGIPFEDSP